MKDEQTSERKQWSAEKEAAFRNFDFSNNEKEVANIEIPNSLFMGKWVKDKGYAVGLENIQITKYEETLEKALNKIGYGVDKDEEGDEILVKVGETDFETIVRIVNALLIINKENNG